MINIFLSMSHSFKSLRAIVLDSARGAPSPAGISNLFSPTSMLWVSPPHLPRIPAAPVG